MKRAVSGAGGGVGRGDGQHESERERGPSGPGHGGEMEGGQLISVHPSIRTQRRHGENGR